MGGYFNIAGRKVATHHLVLGVLASYGLGIKAALPNPDKTQAPPINASSAEEGEFVQQFLKAFEEEENKTKTH
ncbi:hypothetical protein IWW55_003960 [Coemansia sp. RSA 2706]|nr:hypothetical protein LPJ63_002922 [Coemansia sp. RSA 2711]KAJ2300451.1 hypothetical protein IWW55_003960 [Coemansia sp. RSA 2706]KAJ2305889.1 hypothetical protein IWW54_004930 [Coemansia sp. RSA 2705]KAJ2312972.1 hypothetical protein IWW52_004703 [Coemansia sp. RSA 2704]KAJ2323956.1 hypothetical protein IWW51_003509 [Coemansia sp. RSA 2702]KAJ2369396.1 hypothetical protein H4S01_001030 [Coemansia sp. RSA 2610]KAJ2385622.1 hypothetical protein H4S02_004239 [Coemansia sp. RSA 2611]KAJ272143